MSSALMQVHVTVAGVSVIIQMGLDSFMVNFVSVTIENALMMKQKKYVEAMESVTVETVTARLVGMEINVSSSARSPPGRASEDALLQMAGSAATEELVCVVNVPAMTLTPQETGETSTGTPASVMKGTAELSMTGTRMTSAPVMGSVTVEDVTAKLAGPGRSANTHDPVHCPWRRATEGAKGARICPVLGGGSVNVGDVLATRQGIAGCTGRLVSVMTGAVRTWTVWCVEAMAHAPAAAVSAREAGLGSCASTLTSVT